MSDVCQNPACEHGNEPRAMAFQSAPFCCDDCKRAAGADVSSVGTYMFLTTEEAALIKNRRAEAEEHPIIQVPTPKSIARELSLGEQMGHPGGHYG